MSKGRKNRTETYTATGTSGASILSNLTASRGGKRKDLTRDTTTFTKNFGLGWDDDSDVIEGRKDLRAQAQEKANTLVDIPQETIDSLNIRFQQRAGEVLRRTTFQGRDQLILTDRD